MIAYWFKMGTYIGLVIAKNKTEAFDAIDEFGDPYLCQVITATTGGFCCLIKEVGDEADYSELEISSCAPLLDDHRWRDANWPRHSTCRGER